MTQPSKSLSEIEQAFLDMGITKDGWKKTYEAPEPIEWPWRRPKPDDHYILSNNTLPPMDID